MIQRQLYYVCEDPIHREDVEQWVAELRGEVIDHPAWMSACLADLDFLPLGMHVEDLIKELSHYPPCPTAVRGFNLTTDQCEWFASHGIMTFRRLSRAALAKLLN